MRLKQAWCGQVVDGQIQFDNAADFTRELGRLEGQRVKVSLSKFRKSRSDNENRYYWGVVVAMLASELGYTSEEMHEILKGLFLSSLESFERNGKRIEVRIVESTADLSTVEFEQFLAKIRQWASLELGIYIPLPNEVEENFIIKFKHK